jgi:hypothetical protein
MRPRPEVKGTVLGLAAYLGHVTAWAWLVLVLIGVGAMLPLALFGPPYGLAVGVGCAQLMVVLWGGNSALRRGLNRRLPEGPPRSW